MYDTLTQFQWTVAPAGHQILTLTPLDSNAEEDVYLTNSVPFYGSYMGARYSPQAGLFRSFADLKPRKDQILEFANQWGMLTAGIPLRHDSHTIMGELLDFWKKHIRDLSFALRLWELAKAADSVATREYVTWAPDSSGVRFDFPSQRGSRWIAAKEWRQDLLGRFHTGDTVGPSWYQLQHMVNENLQGKLSPQLLWNPARTRSGSETKPGLSLHQVPNDLISALWLQFARAIDGERVYQQCEECRNWFEVSSPDGGRKDKRYCSTSCRARSWRNTRKEEK